MNTVVEQGLKYFKEPVRLAFLGSVILSLIAFLGFVTIGKDGAFYIDIAQSVSRDGLHIAFERFNWPWYSILISLIHSLTSLDHELIAMVLSVLFMAGACSCVVATVKNKTPEAAYWAVLLVLSIPVFNGFRESIIRDTGFWFFVLLTVWAVSTSIHIGFIRGFAIQLFILAAALFRLEAVFIIPAVFVYLLVDGRVISIKDRFLNVFSVTYIFSLIAFIGIVYILIKGGLSQERIDYYFNLVNPYKVYQTLLLKSDQFAKASLLKWSYSDAGMILFFGFLFTLIIRLLEYAGVFSLFLLSGAGRRSFLVSASNYKINSISMFFYFIVLLTFFIQVGFINSRYSSMFVWLAVPMMSITLYELNKGFPKLTKAFVIVSILFMFANVISTSVKKTHYLEAAEWIMEHTNVEDTIYYEDSRIAYYAGRGYPEMPEVNQVLEGEVERARFKYFVIEASVKDQELLSKAATLNLHLLSEKTNGKKTLYIFKNHSQ